MIWIGFFILGEVRKKFRMEFNAYKNEWVELPVWLRQALEVYLEENAVPWRTMVVPPRTIMPSLETPFIDPDSFEDSEDMQEMGDLIEVAGAANMANLLQTMLWLETQGVVIITRTEQLVENPYERLVRQSPDGELAEGLRYATDLPI